MAKREPPEPELEETKNLNVAVPAGLHRRLRITAATDDMSIRDTVIAALEAYLP